jgi:hypothetical protein
MFTYNKLHVANRGAHVTYFLFTVGYLLIHWHDIKKDLSKAKDYWV